MASQMAAAQIDTVVADLVSGNTHLFRVSGETVRFPGYLAQYGVALVDSEPEKESEEDIREKLPELEEGQTLLLDKIIPEQKFTQPPARYTEASLIKAMEEKGIGRPSTYAPTISTILERKYVEKTKNISCRPNWAKL